MLIFLEYYLANTVNTYILYATNLFISMWQCAVHPQDEIRTRAIRLVYKLMTIYEICQTISISLLTSSILLFGVGQVANKLYQLSYVSEEVEQFAKQMLLSAVDQKVLETGLAESEPIEQGTDTEV